MMTYFQRVLNNTERHPLNLKASHVRFLAVRPDTLSQIRTPPPVLEAPAIARIEAPSEPLAERPPQSLADVETALAELRERASICVKCPHLVKSRKSVDFGAGDIHAQLMFVGE